MRVLLKGTKRFESHRIGNHPPLQKVKNSLVQVLRVIDVVKQRVLDDISCVHSMRLESLRRFMDCRADPMIIVS